MKIIIDEQKKEVSLYPARRDFNSGVLETLFSWYKSQPKMEDIDEELRPLIKDMLNNGYKTFSCCSGHGKVLGYVIFLPPRKRRLRSVFWKPNEPIPQRVSELKVDNGMYSRIIMDRGDGGISKWLEIKKRVEGI